MKGPQPLHMKSAAATCAARGAAASRFLDHFPAVRAAHRKMMFEPLQGCLGRLAATDRRQSFVDGLRLPPLGASFHLSAQRYRLLLRPLFAFTVATASMFHRTSSSMTFHLSVSIMSIILSQMSLLLWMMASYHTRSCPARERRQEIQAARPNVSFALHSFRRHPEEKY